MFSPKKLIQLFVIITCLFIVGVVSIQAEEDKKSQAAAYPFIPGMHGMPGVPMPSTESVNYAMQKMMDPNTMILLMSMMMNPKDVTAEAICVTCHMGEDIARYQTYYGPMLEAMWQPFKTAMDPATYTGMMGMADPMGGYGSMGVNNPMFNPAMWMNPMTWMNPGNYMGMMNPMTWMNAGNYMQMMNPMAYMNMMYPMMGMAGPMMGGMGQYGNPMAQMPGMGQMPGGQMMDPKQYEQWFSQWTEMMKNFTPQAQQ